MRKIIQILLFVISYAPLYIILLFQNIDDKYLDNDQCFIGISNLCYNNRIALTLLALTTLSIILYFILYKIVLKSSPIKITIKNKRDNNDEHLSYLATYILPFVGLHFDTWQSLASSIVLFYVLGTVYIRTNLILTNPTLTFFGFFILKIETSNDKTYFLIHKGEILKGNEYTCIHLIDNIYLQKL